MEAALTDNVAPLLIVNNIEVVYDHVILVLKGVSLEVPEGGMSPGDQGPSSGGLDLTGNWPPGPTSGR